MPPRTTPNRGGSSQGGDGRGRGGGRGGRGRGAPARGGSSRGGAPTSGQTVVQGGPQSGLPASHVTTVGVRRPGFGTAGRAVKVFVNVVEATVPDGMIYHYDVVIDPEVGPRFNFRLITHLQELETAIFSPKAVYDGRKNLFASTELPLGESHSREFQFSIDPPGPNGRPPKLFKVRLTRVAEISTELLHRFINGQQSMDNRVSTALMALNVVVRMTPSLKYPHNARSFFTDKEMKPNVGYGLEFWRGYFQSVRPAIGRLLINVDISSAMMYEPGPLIPLCLKFLGQESNPGALVPNNYGLSDARRHQLQRFISGVRVQYNPPGQPSSPRTHTIIGLGRVGAKEEVFKGQDGQTTNVAEYFRRLTNRPLQHPNMICVKVGARAMLPLEACTVLKGQICRKDVPALQDTFREFSTKKPIERFASIKNGLSIFEYGQSEYIRQFGLTVNEAGLPLQIKSRVLPAPELHYGGNSNIAPIKGVWNMIGKKLYQPKPIGIWAIVVFDSRIRDTKYIEKNILEQCSALGIVVDDPKPVVVHGSGQNVTDTMKKAGAQCRNLKKGLPNLVFVILPQAGNDIYREVKYFGDALTGVATQCLIGGKAGRGSPQYWANVLLKVNPKLGGINHKHKPSSVAVLSEPGTPTIIMGADVNHPSPGRQADEIPSFPALVSSVDSAGTKYIAKDSIQRGRQEIISDLKAMVKYALEKFKDYHLHMERLPETHCVPKRLIFYRDGVAENQFEEVKEKELELIKAACKELKMNPKITFIVVGKRHHIRFKPEATDPNKPGPNADKSLNCVAGTIVDRDITHPTDFDFYLQSHGGLLGTSRSAHYSVLADESQFSADALQSLTYALCHVFARSTRSVSIPAPVYYADIVCGRARTRFDPKSSIAHSDSGSTATVSGDTLEAYKAAFKPLNSLQALRMYYM